MDNQVQSAVLHPVLLKSRILTIQTMFALDPTVNQELPQETAERTPLLIHQELKMTQLASQSQFAMETTTTTALSQIPSETQEEDQTLNPFTNHQIPVPLSQSAMD